MSVSIEHDPLNLEARLRNLGIVQSMEPSQLASGVIANTKVDADVILPGLPEFDQTVDGLCELAEEFKPDLLVPMPSGADRFVEAMSYEMDIPYVALRKQAGKLVLQNPYYNCLMLRGKSRILLVDDVYTSGSTIKKALAVKELVGKSILGAVVIWDRSEEKPKETPVPLKSLIHHHVPYMTGVPKVPKT